MTRIVFDIEANGLENPDQIWCVVCKDLDTGERKIFRKVTQDEVAQRGLVDCLNGASCLVGHNCLGYDVPVLCRLLPGLCASEIVDKTIDTLIISRMVDYPRDAHSIEDYGKEFNLYKGDWTDWSKYSLEMEEYCIRDVDICELVYKKYKKYINDPARQQAIRNEHQFQYYVVNALEDNGFSLNKTKAEHLLEKVKEELSILDKDILDAFRPRLKLIREVTPKATKYGTISLSSIPKSLRDRMSEFSVDGSFCHCEWVEFNPSSHGQIIKVLNEAGWQPLEKTKTHIDAERELQKLKFQRQRSDELDLRIETLHTKLSRLAKTGWKVNEHNLDTLPPDAPKAAKLLARRIVIESRRRTLTEWLELLREDGRIHGRFFGIGAWTHRMAHRNPNTANIPNEFDTQGKKKPYGKELRSLWQAPKNRLLVGCDAEGIQLRIFAHYINDPEFTQALVNGKKEDKSDPHSLNQSILGSVCKSRAAAKRYIYALLLGAGSGKLREILDCSEEDASEAYSRLLSRYTGFAELKETIIPADAKRGWFLGLDGRAVRILGDTVGARKHLAMSGYLQNGEAVAMKIATLKWATKLKDYDAKLVNFVHDEWQVECPNNVSIALEIAKMMAESLEQTGKELGLLCPLAGSYYSDDLKDYTIATNWSKTH